MNLKPDQHVLLIGTPGTGRTMWARRQTVPARWGGLSGLDYAYQVAGLPVPTRLHERGAHPFRAPHHTISEAAMRGTLHDGYRWRPGELNLAHGGILFLDEVTEFAPRVLDTVREALGAGRTHVAGGGGIIQAPAVFRLIATMHPCPCGYRNATTAPDRCRCTEEQVKAHNARVPGWLRERCVVLHEDAYKADLARLLKAEEASS